VIQTAVIKQSVH